MAALFYATRGVMLRSWIVWNLNMASDDALERQRIQNEIREKVKKRRQLEKNRSFSSMFTVTEDDEKRDAELNEYLVNSNLSKAEKNRRMTSGELALAIQFWSTADLQQLWGMRVEKLSTLQDCAKLLSYLRFEMGIDSLKQDPATLMTLDSIKHLEGVLDDVPMQDDTQVREQDFNQKRIESVLQVIREGQGSFRRALINYYGPVCMITGIREAKVIDAAHIVPYGGKATNTIANGLLLRKDIHVLFDSGLIRIEDDFSVRVSEEVSDSAYRLLDGGHLIFGATPTISRKFLRERSTGKIGSGAFY